MTTISRFFFLLPLTLCLSLAASQNITTTAATKNTTAAAVTANTTATAAVTANTTATAKANTTTTTTAASLIAKACGESQRKDFCVSLLTSDPKSQNADLKGLAFIALKAAARNATEISARIKLLLNDTNVAPSVDDGLTTCDKAYLDVVDQIEDSVNALVSNANGDVQTWVKAAIADIDTCEGSVKGQSELAVELSRKNRVLRQLCNTALGIVHVLARKN